MTSFRDKERAEETKYAHDREHEFRVTARRNKLIGLWAAEKLGLVDEQAAAYALEIVEEDFKGPGDEHVVTRIKTDLADKGVTIDEKEIHRQMLSTRDIARQQLDQ